MEGIAAGDEAISTLITGEASGVISGVVSEAAGALRGCTPPVSALRNAG